MTGPAISFLLFLAFLTPGLIAAWSGPDLRSPASFFLAPLLHLAAARLRHLAASGLLYPAAISAGGQVIVGTFLIGGAAYAYAGLLPGQPAAFAGGGLAAALLTGLALSLGDPFGIGDARERRMAHVEGMPRLTALLEAHGTLTLVLAAPLVSALSQGAWSSRGFTVHLPALLASLALGCAAGATSGLWGGWILRRTRSPAGSAIVHLAAAEAGAVAASFLGGSLPVAALSSGLASGWLSPAGSRSASGPASGPFSIGSIATLASAGVLVAASSGITLPQLWAALPAAAVLWGAAVLIRFPVHWGFGGIVRWRRPRDIPAGWLPALAWASCPGAAAAGLLLEGSRVPPPAGSLGLPSEMEAAPLLAIVIAILVQGSSRARALRGAERGSAPAPARHRWEWLSAVAVALRAERRAVEELHRKGELDDEAAASMEEAIRAGETGVESSLLSLSRAEPSLRAQKLTAAVRAAIVAGREAVSDACDRGWLTPAAAEEVERELARRWSRAGLASLGDLLGGPSAPLGVPGKKRSASTEIGTGDSGRS